MGLVTTDQGSPGRRQVQRYSIGGGLSTNKGDQESKPYSFLLLKNCLVDKRLNALLKRPGSTLESPGSSLGLPLGVGEYVTEATGALPINSALLFNFAGTFKQFTDGSWSSVSTSAYTNFSTSRQSQFAKLGQNLFIAGGRPAKWKGSGYSIDRVGIVPPTIKPVISSVSSVGPIVLQTGTQYMITYYDSTTGLESDWSDLSLSSGPVSVHGIDIQWTPDTQQNWDKVRIYRTLDGGAFPYFVDEVPASTSGYTDTKLDEDLTFQAAERYSRSTPPGNVFVVARFTQHVVYVDSLDPYTLHFSNPYTGDNNELEYFNPDNTITLNEPITGIFVVPGKMLVFHPRNISYVSGFTIDDFVVQSFIPGIGTVFPNSISTNGTEIVFLAEQGFVAIGADGGLPRYISREIDLDLQTFLTTTYNTSLYVSTCWNPSLRQFIFMVNARSNAAALWEELGNGSTATAVAGWQTTPGLVDDVWEDVGLPDSSYAMKVRIWGWSPELSSPQENTWMEYTFPEIDNDNVNSAYPIFVYHPQPSDNTSGPQQDKTYLGYWDGTQGKIRSCFRRDKNQDDSTNITSEWLTGRLQPGVQSGGYKIFQAVGFDNSYSDPTSDSNCTLKYLKDFDDPQIRSYSGSLITISGSTDQKILTQALAKHIHLYGTDTSQSQTKILLGEFFITYRERFRRSSR